MSFRRGILVLILIGAVGLLWAQREMQQPAKQTDVQVPPVKAASDFFGFPWGISRTEAIKLAQAKNLEPTPKVLLGERGPGLYYNTTFAGYPAKIVLDFQERTDPSLSFFDKGSLILSSQTSPAEQIYWKIHKELTKEYGQTAELGYPPRRNFGDSPWGPGSGAIWEVKSPDGQLFEIETSISLADRGFMEILFCNVSVGRRFKNLVNPTPDGDPAKAASDLAGFMDIPWGATQGQFRQGMEKKGFSVVAEKTAPLNRGVSSEFNNGTYAGYPVSVKAYFDHNSMFMVSVNIRGDENGGWEAVFNRLKAFLQERYGAPGEEQDWRHETFYIWRFPVEGFKPNQIMLHRSGSTVIVLYKNEALEDKLKNL